MKISLCCFGGKFDYWLLLFWRLCVGRDNIYNKMNKAEREMFFKAPETEVREVLNAQRDEGIVEGPKGSQESESEGHGRAFHSILDFAGF